MPSLSPYEFLLRWRAMRMSERASAQHHSLDLCDMLDEPKPHEVDPNGAW